MGKNPKLWVLVRFGFLARAGSVRFGFFVYLQSLGSGSVRVLRDCGFGSVRVLSNYCYVIKLSAQLHLIAVALVTFRL